MPKLRRYSLSLVMVRSSGISRYYMLIYSRVIFLLLFPTWSSSFLFLSVFCFCSNSLVLRKLIIFVHLNCNLDCLKVVFTESLIFTMPKVCTPKAVLYKKWIESDKDFAVEDNKLFCKVCSKSVSVCFFYVGSPGTYFFFTSLR